MYISDDKLLKDFWRLGFKLPKFKTIISPSEEERSSSPCENSALNIQEISFLEYL